MKLSTLFLLLVSVSCFSQIGGRATYQFLNLETSARHSALGGKLVTDRDNNPIGGLYNPATINITMDKNYALNYVNYIGDINYGSAATAIRLFRQQKVLHIGVIYANYGDFEGFDQQGVSTGDFSASEAALSFGYAQEIRGSDFSVGASLKVINSKLERYTSFGIAADVGVLYYKEEWDLNIGLSVRNIGTQITTYAGVKEKLPLSVDAGISQIPKNIPVRWFLSFQNLQFWNLAFSNSNRTERGLSGEVTKVDDPGFFNNVLRHTIFGLELFPKGAINIRLGYNFRRGEELKIVDQRSFAGLSAGFSLRIKKLTFNYSYARYNLAAASSTFGLNLNFGKQ